MTYGGRAGFEELRGLVEPFLARLEVDHCRECFFATIWVSGCIVGVLERMRVGAGVPVSLLTVSNRETRLNVGYFWWGLEGEVWRGTSTCEPTSSLHATPLN